jgi:hypothetical protein
MVMFTMLGAFWYIVDRLHGVRWYRRWYRLTHESPLPANVTVGFVYNRRSRHKVVMAAVVSTLQTFIALTSVESLNLLVELILWIVEIPMVMLGFAIGPLVFKVWKRKDTMLDAIDDFEQSHFGNEELQGSKPTAKKAPRADDAPKPETPAPSSADDKPDAKQLFDRYTKR